MNDRSAFARTLGCALVLTGAFALAACGGSDGPPETAVYEVARTSHFLAAPFPSDTLRTLDGTINLRNFPTAEGLTTPIFKGYVRRFGTSVYGFGLSTGLYQKFSGALATAPLDALRGRAPAVGDPILLFPLSATTAADLVPLDARFLASANGDPYLTDNLLLANPRTSAPLRGGVSYAFIVRGDVLRSTKNGPIARDPAFEAIMSERDGANAQPLQISTLKQTLAKLGIAQESVASATVFTTQDVDQQFQAIRTKVEASLRDEHLDLRSFKEVSRIAYTMAQTQPHLKDSARLTVTFKDGSTDTTEMDPEPSVPAPYQVDSTTFPYRVFEGRLRTLNFQGPLGDKPYGTPGLGIINDAALDTGQIRFQKESGGRLSVTSLPEAEELRVVIAVPLDGQRRLVTNAPVIFSDHGTGGSAYNALISPSGLNRSPELTTRFAAHRAILVSRDQPLFGQRFPTLVDRGFNVFLVAYNIANITAFRDNLRQSAIDNLVTWRFVKDKLNAFLTAQQISATPVADTAKLFRFGHSLGSVTSHLATAFLPQTFTSTFVSGSGGLLSLFFLDSGLLPRLAGDPENLGVILQALNIDPRGPVTPAELIGGLAGVPPGAGRAQIGRDHPVITLAQTLLDPADPISYARRLSLPVHLLRAPGDLQVPNSATDALLGVLPMATLKPCIPTRADYDPHQCLFREDQGLSALGAWLDAFLPAP